MFGYIRIFKPELTFREYEQYRGLYCSLCESLGRRYGFAARMTLSYDFTFLSMFRMSLFDKDPQFTMGRCPFRPTKKRAFCNGECVKELDYAADVAVILTYHKLTDTISDERFFKRIIARISRAFLKKDFRKACAERPEEATWAQEFMDAQALVEKEKTAIVDAAAHPTAVFLSKLASLGLETDEDRELAARFGYGLGRFIYLMDASEDLLQDVRNGNYNVFASAHPNAIFDSDVNDKLKEYMSQTLHNTVAFCTECYEQLPVKHFDAIIRNILYVGMPAVIARIQHPLQEDSAHEKSV